MEATPGTSQARPPRWKFVVAFAIIYFVWGSTFLAIRVGVVAMPPLVFAALRFPTAGFLLTSWLVWRGERLPRPREWLSIFVLGFLIFLVNYGLLFWAERRVPSGIAAIIMGTIPLFMSLAEILLLGTQRLSARLVAASLIGIGGVSVLVSQSFHLGGEPVDRPGALALIGASVAWSIASALSRKMPLPASKVMSAGGQMLVGGLLLALAAVVSGEFSDFHPSAINNATWFSLIYLIVFGSLIAFTAYVWLIHHESPTKVGTYAYVNPVVAVVMGYFFGGESLGLRTVIGIACVLTSVVIITTARSRSGIASRMEAKLHASGSTAN